MKELCLLNNISPDTILQIGQAIVLKSENIVQQKNKSNQERKLAQGMTRNEHISLILQLCNNFNITDSAQRAYILATAEHESDKFQARDLEEYAS